MAHFSGVCHKILQGTVMIERRSYNNQIKCTECNRWFHEDDNTLFLKLYSQSRSQNIAAFCSSTCKRKFHNKIFPAVNNAKDIAC